MSHVSDSDHRRLEAKVFPDYCVVESLEISDASRGWRRVPVTRVWRTERLLGRGGFGEVHLQSQETEKDMKRALKIIPTRGIKLSFEECQRELTALIEFTKPKYRNAAVFVDFMGWFQNDDAMFLAMEYMPLGDLEHNLQEIENSPTQAGQPLSEEEVQEISRQILEGLKIMHAEGFAHRDLKPQNVFVVQKQPQWWVKLGDFGLSKKRTDGTAYRTQAGTQQYMAPELFYYVQELDTETSEYTNAIDLWSLGCIIHRIVTGAVPFPSLLSLRNYCRDPSRVTLHMPSTMKEAASFVENLLMPHPAKRPVASIALESTWLTTRNKPKIALDEIRANFTALDISRSQNNYITVSHKGLQSYVSLPTTNDSLTEPIAEGPVTDPLPSPANKIHSKTIIPLPQLIPADENKPNSVEMNTIKHNPETSPVNMPPPNNPPHSMASHPTPSTTNTLTTEILREKRQQVLEGRPQTRTNENIVDAPNPTTAAQRTRQPRSIIGEVVRDPTAAPLAIKQELLLIPDTVKDPAKSQVLTMKQLPSIDRQSTGPGPLSLRSPKIYPPGTRPQREKLQDSDIKAILTSHNVTDIASTRSQLLTTLNNTFPITMGPGRQFYYWDAHTKKFYCDDSSGSLPLGWETRLSRAREKYYYNTDDGASVWDDPRTSDTYFRKSNAPVKPRSSPVLLPQQNNQTHIPPSIPVAAKGGRPHPRKPNVPEGWAVEFIDGPKGSPYCWRYVNTLTGAIQYSLPHKPASAEDGAISSVQAGQTTSVTPQQTTVWKALYNFDPERESDLRLSKGDMIRVSVAQNSDTPQEGWLVGEVNGRKGTFPSNYCLRVVWMKALFDFDPVFDGDLRLSVGDLIRIINEPPDESLPAGWLLGEVNGRRGMFPANYCE